MKGLISISKGKIRWTVMLFALFTLAGCATFYQRYQAFNSNFEKGKLVEADLLLEKDQKLKESKARLLYYMNRGAVHSILGNYELSNSFLEEAYLIVEDGKRNYFQEAVSMISNPNVIDYRGELHEVLLIHYYKAINFLKMGNHEAALVECRRLNLRLDELSGRIKSDKKYKRDAFSHLIMGLTYEADRDYNNSFIAYRNAVDIYLEDYKGLFGLNVPDQLAQDLFHSATMMGFIDERQHYENILGKKYIPRVSNEHGDVIVFWNNGLGPLKSEWSINFAVIKGEGGMVHFVNDDFGWNFPFNLESSNVDDKDKEGLSALKVFRVAFPKYVERKAAFKSGYIEMEGKQYPFQQTQNINAIAFKVLENRMVEEFGKSLLRIAIKKAAEQSLRKEDKNLGSVLGMINALTEKADTRNWQTIPHSIYYSRLQLPEGEHQLDLKFESASRAFDSQSNSLRIRVESGKTYFHSWHSLEHMPVYGVW
jgi:hypothetical protein